jgi:hypothetical protein
VAVTSQPGLREAQTSENQAVRTHGAAAPFVDDQEIDCRFQRNHKHSDSHAFKRPNCEKRSVASDEREHGEGQRIDDGAADYSEFRAAAVNEWTSSQSGRTQSRKHQCGGEADLSAGSARTGQQKRDQWSDDAQADSGQAAHDVDRDELHEDTAADDADYADCFLPSNNRNAFK